MQSPAKKLLSTFLFTVLWLPSDSAFAGSSARNQGSQGGAQQPASTTTSQAKPAPAFAFGIEDGTKVSLKLARDLSSATESAGNRVDFDVAEEVKVDGIVVIPVGAKAWGTIVDAKPKRRLGRAGRLDVRIDEVRLASGERVPLRASQEAKGKGRGGLMTGAIIASGILFFPVAPVFLFMHGKDVVIAKGAPVTAYVNQNVPLDPAKFTHEPGSASDRSATPMPSSVPEVAEPPGSTPKPPN